MDSIQEDFITMGGGPEITIAFATGAIGGLLIYAAAMMKGSRKFNKGEIEKNLKYALTIKDAKNKEAFLKKIQSAIGEKTYLSKEFGAQVQKELDNIQSKLPSVDEAEGSGDEIIDILAATLKSANIDPASAAKESQKIEDKIKGETSSQNEEIEEMEEELMEARKTISVLRSELNEINLLNAKLLYSNKIFKAKNLNESQKVKVLSSFDKAKNVSEVKIVFETLNEGIKTAKSTIKENLGRASKSTNTPTTKRPILESNDAFKRMQKLAGLI
jgi:esterase/lipase